MFNARVDSGQQRCLEPGQETDSIQCSMCVLTVASKGVWSLGNELRRPCGPNVTSSHMAVDKIATRPPAQLRTEK
ncbi:hypothetical protein ACOMHN_018882 [Nucella lapillus]